MLKRLVRHRLFQAFLVLALVIAGLATPLRHDYSYVSANDTGLTGCDVVCYGGEPSLQTEVQYGVPFTWLKLDKVKGDTTGKVYSQTKSLIAIKLAFDLASYVGVILIVYGILKLDDRTMHANFRH